MSFIAAWAIGLRTIYRDGSGAERVRDGGSRSWRNNNPGNVSKGSFADAHGAIGGDSRFAIFPDEATGFEAIQALFRTSTYRDLSIKDAIYKYAPPNENASDDYAKIVAKKIGVPISTNVSALTDSQLHTLATAIQTHEGWKPGKEYDGSSARFAENLQEVDLVAASDTDHIADLIAEGKNAETLQQAQDTAAKSMEAAGYGYTHHRACAATLSALLNMSGIKIKTELNAARLAKALQTRGWEHVDVGSQAAGDVGVAKKNVHIFLVVEARGADRMLIADNQAPSAHVRYASGKGRTPTDYFLRAGTGAFEAFAALAKQDQSTYPSEDEATDDL